ncbi:DNA/RNA non-specific endonuclease [Cellulomonas endophytica]|uniref:DNA/RNA non-specific endonuclease n=1 Tax=Cellulomonas endophytica TaxID=2494735 RepID=UPI001F0BBE69|nr:DNA/RNA non-specific endonuclease [Cellulomonas endophytica]
MQTTSRTTPAGHDPAFLGPEVPLPVPPRPVRTLPSTHFTVLLDPVRRLAAATVVDVDGSGLVEVPRGDDWRLDPRVPEDEQAGPELYARNDLDRGHLVRRRDPVWGPPEVAARANADTFLYPNAAPQAARFNQGEDLWVGLEDHVLEHARAQRRRLVVLTGPVLADDDPVYRGVGIPLLFWKVAAWAEDGALRALAFVLDQEPLLDGDELEQARARAQAADAAPPLGPFRTFTVPVADVAARTGLDLGPLVAADVQGGAVVAASVPTRTEWVPLTSGDDVRRLLA